MSNAEDIEFEIFELAHDRIWSNLWGQFYGFMIHETGQKYVSAPVRDVILGMKNRLSDDIITYEY